ncbi:hypothetical protein H257_16812 [Aphanomyces astaci]|uniref:Uncharacterized protein n=1 Tax=Aphanomyces astaci TaxID=112090 RepID=W4FJF9_APHAT|nr:hypothetical protein H257_16812 [Aphanomyces astaci]ETV66883.1 hypothetical protein H257_16812 [Aphanomyces astaci]|eukprot:XP_009843686.1 hypothetical protein H257_16812 [Aphanomyces astaci]
MDQLDAINTAMHAFSNLSKARKGWGSHTFSKHEPGWTFWCYLYQWVIQEVASFQGDAGRVTVLTTVIERDMYALDALEIPRSLSLYFMWGVQYSLILVYIVTSRCCIGPFNLFELDRVGAIVWADRLLILLRSLSALSLLSTGKLELKLTDLCAKEWHCINGAINCRHRFRLGADRRRRECC